MANSKFFSGLSEKMMSRNYNGPNRQATHFYWPDETDADEIPLPKSRSRRTSVSSVTSAAPSVAQVPAADLELLRKKHLKQMESKIDQYITADATSDTESEKRDRRPRKLNLSPKKESFDYQEEPINYRKVNNSPKRESFDYQDEPISHRKPPKPESPAIRSRERRDSRDSREYREPPRITVHQVARQQSQELERHMRHFSMNDANGLCTDYSASREPQPRRQQSYEDSYSESDDDYSVIGKNRGYQGYQEERRTPHTPKTPSTPQTPDLDYVADYRAYERNRKPKYRVRAPERVNSRNKLRAKQYSPEVSDEDHYDFDKQKSSYEQLNQQKTPPRSVRGQETQLKETLQTEEDAAYYTDVPRPPSSNKNGYSSEMETKRAPRTKQSMASTPGKPLSRSSSINEAKKRALIHLNSNIFHNNPDYNMLSEHRKPTTVREAAGHSRVGVGLPDL